MKLSQQRTKSARGNRKLYPLSYSGMSAAARTRTWIFSFVVRKYPEPAHLLCSRGCQLLPLEGLGPLLRKNHSDQSGHQLSAHSEIQQTPHPHVVVRTQSTRSSGSPTNWATEAQRPLRGLEPRSNRNSHTWVHGRH